MIKAPCPVEIVLCNTSASTGIISDRVGYVEFHANLNQILYLALIKCIKHPLPDYPQRGIPGSEEESKLQGMPPSQTQIK